MINRTSISAIRTLVYLALAEPGVISPRRIADELGESPSYLSKVCRLLVKAGILRAEKGMRGGVQLGKPAAEISLLAIVEACQGALTGGHCYSSCSTEEACSFHQAAAQLREAMAGVMSQWGLERLARNPRPAEGLPDTHLCMLAGRPR